MLDTSLPPLTTSELTDQVAALTLQWEQRDADLRAAEQDCARLKATLTCLKHDLEERQYAELRKTMDTPDWTLLLTEEGPQAVTTRQQLTQVLRACTTFAGHRGLSSSGYNVHTLQRSLRVSLIQGLPALTARVADTLAAALPFVVPCTPSRASDVVKYIPVSESSLSAYQSYYLAIDEARGVYELRGTRSARALHTAPTLPALLAYVEQNHYATTLADE